MFTGIIESAGRVREVRKGRMLIETGFDDMVKGESVAVNGVCLTVSGIVSVKKNITIFVVDVSPETLKKTNLGQLGQGETVNMERALKAGDRFGGHMVTGHIDGTGRIKSIKKHTGFRLIEISLPEEMFGNIVSKGSIAVDGISLTVADILPAGSFNVSIIPHTAEVTTLGGKKAGDRVNVELDVLGKYVQKGLQDKKDKITESFLREKGFI